MTETITTEKLIENMLIKGLEAADLEQLFLTKFYKLSETAGNKNLPEWLYRKLLVEGKLNGLVYTYLGRAINIPIDLCDADAKPPQASLAKNLEASVTNAVQLVSNHKTNYGAAETAKVLCRVHVVVTPFTVTANSKVYIVNVPAYDM